MPAPDYAVEYSACRSRVRAMLADVSPTDAGTIVPSCPDWTVRDVCAHIAGVSAALVARDNPGPDVQAWVDRLVQERQDKTVAELLDEWESVGPGFESIMRAVPKAFGGLVYDVVAHEHDIRGALGRPGDRESDGVWASLEILVAMVQRDLAAHGPTPGVLHLRADDREWMLGSGEPKVSIDTSAWELMRLLGSRRSRVQILASGWKGDVEPFIAAMAHLPLPVSDMVE